MERTFGRYVKAHGYAIAIAALTFGCIFAANVASVGDLQQMQVSSKVAEGVNPAAAERTTVGTYYFRMRPLAQLIFSLVWVLAGTVFLVGMLFEKKETIFPFATIFLIDWSVILMQHLTNLERRSFTELMLSSDTVVLTAIPLYVGYTLAVLYKLFESRPPDDADCDDLESARKQVKFTMGEEFDDSWIS